MSAETLIFYAFALLTAGGALALALSRNVIYAAWILFVVLFGMAGMYVFAGAEFLAVSQVIIYVGGILVIILFGVMLTQKIRGNRPRTGLINILPGLMLAVGMFLALLQLIFSLDLGPLPGSAPRAESALSDVSAIGQATVTDFLLPFEAISVLLLAALMGAAYLTRKHYPASKKEDRA
ncbi:MAG: NADH-quinone oxidoreductase subunit J [Bacteroidota bacterium]